MTQHARHSAPCRGEPWVDAAVAQLNAARQFCRNALGERQVWLASNRGPVEYSEQGRGLVAHGGQGGLVTALRAFSQVTPVHWVACAMTPLDAQAAREAGGVIEMNERAGKTQLSFVAPERREYEGYYDAIANSVLWLMQHQVNHAPTHPTFNEDLWRAWHNGYKRVNGLFAQHIRAAVNRSGRAPVFLVQDYHLYLLPGLLREHFPEAPILHFTHIPWPGADSWRQLPVAIRKAIFNHLLHADVVGFHAPRYVSNFLSGCEELMGLDVDRSRAEVCVEGRQVKVRACPISVDPLALRTVAESPRVRSLQTRWASNQREKLVVLIARTDPSKNLLRTLSAFEHFLERYPEWHSRVRLTALLPLSRQTTEIYKEYSEELRERVRRLNAVWGQVNWSPVELLLRHDYEQAIALMKRYDVLLVTSLADGMNLVAKEGPLLNQRAGVLVLSETTGACDELGKSCQVINPFDLLGTAEALHAALETHASERRWAQESQRAIISANTIFHWVQSQFAELLGTEHPPRQTAGVSLSTYESPVD